jgi:predicted ATPase
LVSNRLASLFSRDQGVELGEERATERGPTEMPPGVLLSNIPTDQLFRARRYARSNDPVLIYSSKMDKISDFRDLRPWPDLPEKDRLILEYAYHHSLESEEALTGQVLRFDTGCSREDVDRLNRQSLLRGGDGRAQPTVMALLYIPRAQDDLRLLDALARFAHDRYRPSNVVVPWDEIDASLRVFEQPRFRTLAEQIGLRVDAEGLHPSETNWERPTLREAFLGVHGGVFHDPSEPPKLARMLAPLPFTFRLTRLQATRFRGLVDVSIELRPLTVLVGPNGVGKSTVLDALGFLRTATNRSLTRAVKDEGGMQRLRTRGTEGPVQLCVEFAIDHGHGPMAGLYEIVLDELGRGVVVEHETLWLDDNVLLDKRRGQTIIQEPHVSHASRLESPAELGLAIIGKQEEYPMLQGIRAALGQIVLVDREPMLHANDWDELIGRSSGARRSRAVVRYSDVLSTIVSDADAMSRLSSIVTELLPNVRSIEATGTPDEPDLLISIQGAAGGLRLDEISSGTRQILLYAALYVAPVTPRAVLIEEPDAGIHPGGQAALVHLLRSLAEKCVVVATTHSPAFVARLSAADEVKAMSPTDDGPRVDALAQVIRGQRWLQSFDDIGEAFARGTRKD